MNQHRGEHPLTPDLPPSVTQNRTAAPAGGRSPVDFDLAEALRLRALGWSYRRIARQMNNISRETVRTRVRDYEAQFRVATPEPVQQPPVPVQQKAPVADYKAPVCPPAAPRPDPMPPVPQTPAVRPPVPPEQPVTPPSPPPEPSTNLDGLVQYWRMKGRPDFTPDWKCFFLVNGQKNVVFGTGSEQLVVAIDQWHQEYYDLDVFQHAERVWVVLVPSEDNRVFLLSLVNDIRVRENCMVVRSDVFRICQDRYAWLRNHRGDFMSAIYDAEFEKVYGFQPMPQPNHVREIEELLRPPKPPDVPSSLGGAFGGTPPQASFNEVPQKGDKSCGFAF